MKRLGRVLGNLLAVALTVFSMQTLAETQLGGRDFNHMTTGFPLSGGHAAAACETCHMGGVFKGLPRTCDGCHQAGQRIVATPKSNSHIVTDAPCETCHFNTSTWLGARFNHGTARAGKCDTCHNGRISTGKPARTAVGAHPVTTESCDQCHRASAWVPASWNHNGVTGDCSGCHRAGGAGRSFNALTHMSQSLMTTMGIANCNACHKNFYTFYSAFYDHSGASQDCNTCHGNPSYVGVKQKVSGIHTVAQSMALTCRSCHKSYASFAGAKFDHVGASLACQTCHGTYNTPMYSGVPAPTAAIHSVLSSLPVTTTCNSCHKSFGTFSGAIFDHAGATQCSLCHSGAYASSGIRGKSASHIPYNGTPECSSCHIGTSAWTSTLTGPTLHTTYLAGISCVTCHGPSSPYVGGKKEGSHEGFNGSSPDCSSSGCHRPLGGKGTAYTKWH